MRAKNLRMGVWLAGGLMGGLWLAAASATVPDEAELERWLESDDPLPPSVDTESVNEGALVFLPVPPAKPVHHHVQRLGITPASLRDGWVTMEQCHYNLDRVPATQIVFRPGRVRHLRITRSEGIGNSQVVGESIQLVAVEAGAQLCLRGETRALRRLPDNRYRLRNGPYMRRFLDGYYPMHVTITIDYGASGLAPVTHSPAAQPGFTVRRLPGRIEFDAWFEGRLVTEVLFRRVSP